MCRAIPGEVIAIHEKCEVRFGDVRSGGVPREVCLLPREWRATPGELTLLVEGPVGT